MMHVSKHLSGAAQTFVLGTPTVKKSILVLGGAEKSPGAGFLCPVFLGTRSAGAGSWGGFGEGSATLASCRFFSNENTTGEIPIRQKSWGGREKGGEEPGESTFPSERVSVATIPLMSVPARGLGEPCCRSLRYTCLP